MTRSSLTAHGITMCIGDALRELAGFLDGCEDEGLVTGIGLVERHDREGTRELSAEVELTLSPPAEGEGGLTLRGASVDEAGRLGLSFGSNEPVVPAPDGRVEIEPTDATFGPDGTVTVTLVARIPTREAGAAAEEPTTDGGSTAGAEDGRPDDVPARQRDRDVPPFRDPELLAEVYESCDTFAEMTDAIGMDVTAETVRRYMIDYGIHQPNTYDTNDADEGDGDAADAASHDAEGDGKDPEVSTTTEEECPAPEADTMEDGSPVLLADGTGLPEDVTVETLIETVRASNTLYEVERDIGVEREDALDMLRELDLLDLVVGRLATQSRRDIGREDVVERLREASATAEGAGTGTGTGTGAAG